MAATCPDPDQQAPQGKFREMLDRVKDSLFLVGEHQVALAPLPLAPFHQKSHDLFPVGGRDRFDRMQAVLPEFVDLAADLEVVLSREFRKVERPGTRTSNGSGPGQG